MTQDPFDIVDSGIAPYPHTLSMRTDPACGLYVPRGPVTVSLSDNLLATLSGALFARQTPADQIATVMGHLRVLRPLPEADRTTLARHAAHALNLSPAQAAGPFRPSPQTSVVHACARRATAHSLGRGLPHPDDRSRGQTGQAAPGFDPVTPPPPAPGGKQTPDAVPSGPGCCPG